MLQRFLTFTLVLAMVVMLPSIAIAGGASGSGGGSGAVGGGNGGIQGPGGAGAVVDYVKDRHELGLEYALTNDEFLGQVESAAFKLALASGGVPTPAASVVVEIRNAFKLIDYGKQNKLNAEFVNKTVRAALETAIIPAKVATPGLSDALTLAKLTVSFTTAYAYGFLVGR